MDEELEGTQDTRADALWSKLDTQGDGQVDLKGLQSGLRKINHPLKDADQLLNDIMKAVDTDGDGKIHYSEFAAFVKHAEHQLWRLFRSIDTNEDNALTKRELRSAFEAAGIKVSNAKLDDFFARVDRNHDGRISFEEWRDFLLFIPAKIPGLRSVLSYFSATVKVNQEGDVHVSDEAVESLGYFLAGAIAGIVSRTSTAPLDRLKVYLIAQTGTKSKAIEATKSGAVVQATKHAARPLWDACKELWRAGGIRSLFAGNGLNVLKVMPESAIKFGSYEAAKRVIASLEGHNDPQDIHPWAKFVAGGIGGIVSQFFVYPIDTLKFRMQCETVEGGAHGNALIVRTAQGMWRNSGARSFYRGLPWGLVGMFPYSAIDLGTFEYIKRAVSTRNARRLGCDWEDPQAAPGNVSLAMMGGFSGAVGASLVYPLNLLRTRLQTQGTTQHPRTYTGFMDVTRQTLRGEGVQGLFKGLTPNLLKVVPAVSITYVVYENSKRILHLT